MIAEDLARTLDSLTAEEQESVLAFVQFLKRNTSPAPSPYSSAVSEFVEAHPELLRRLAQ